MFVLINIIKREKKRRREKNGENKNNDPYNRNNKCTVRDVSMDK